MPILMVIGAQWEKTNKLLRWNLRHLPPTTFASRAFAFLKIQIMDI